MSKHTPAPWKICKFTEYKVDHLSLESADNGRTICVIPGTLTIVDHANAALIKAAPLLLEALEDMLDLNHDNASCDEINAIKDRAYAIVAQAKGIAS